MRNLILYLLCLALLCYAAVIYGSEALMLLSFTGISLAVLAYLFIIIQIFLVRVKVSIPIAMVEHGGSTELMTQITSRGILPVPKIRFYFRCKGGLTGKRKRFWVNGAVAARGETTVLRNLEGCHCGCFVYSLKKMRIYDMTGLFYLTKWDRQRVELSVMPRMCEMNVRITERSRYFPGDAEIYDDKKTGPDASELFAVRPFQNGDKIQNIHWKMSAKTDELMVREKSLPRGCPVVLLVDLADCSIGIRSDEALTLAASISLALVKQKCPHYAAWYDRVERDVVRLRVDEEEDLYQFLLMMCMEVSGNRSKEESGKMLNHLLASKKRKNSAGNLKMSGRSMKDGAVKHNGKYGRNTPALRTMYREKYRIEHVVTEITVNQKLEVWKDDTLCRKFDRRRFQEKISDMELVV